MKLHNGVHRGRRIAAISIALASSTALILSGCSSTSTQTTSKLPTFTVAIGAAILSFNPWSSPNGLNGSLWSDGAVYDSLTHLNAQAKPTPWLAKSWKYTDATHLTLNLQSGVKFSDGTKLDAAAVVKNIEYAESGNKTPGECNGYLAGIKATASGATTVKLALSVPNPDLLTDFGTCAGYIVSPKSLANDHSLEHTPVGSGPYVLDQAATVQGQSWVFMPNKNYWNSSNGPRFSKFTLKVFTAATAAANAAKTGQVDMIDSVDAKTDTSGLTLLESAPQQFRGIFLLDIAGKINPALADVRVRQALQYGIDRNTLQKQIFGDTAAVSYSTPFTTATVGYSSALTSRYPYNPTKAKALLAAAGYGKGLTIDDLNYPSNGGDLVPAMAGELAKIGVTLNVSDHPNDFVTQMFGKTWAAVTANYTLSSSTYHNLTGLTGTDGFFNQLHAQDPTLNALLKKVTETTNAQQQASLYSQIAKRIQDQAWFLAPVLVKQASAYNNKKIAVTVTPGLPVPLLYNIKAVGK